jgi:hypothetical protein
MPFMNFLHSVSPNADILWNHVSFFQFCDEDEGDDDDDDILYLST